MSPCGVKEKVIAMDKNLGLMTLVANFIGGVYSRFDILGLRLIRADILAFMPDLPLPIVKDNEVPLLSHGCCQEARYEQRGITRSNCIERRSIFPGFRRTALSRR
jgi:hypothetical protein